PTTALADDLLLEVASQQTGVRAYLVTRQPQMLTAYDRGRAAAQTDLKQIGKFVARRRPSLAPTARTARSQLAALQRSFEREIELVRGGHIVRAEAAGEIAGRQLVGFSHTVEAINDDAGRFIVDARDSQRRTYLVSLVLL